MRTFTIALLIAIGLIAMASCKAATCASPRATVIGADQKSGCYCPSGSHWDDKMCKPNSLYCAKNKFANGSCATCRVGSKKMKYNGQTFCQNWAWWVWFLLALAMLVAFLLFTLFVYGIFYLCQTYCGCCKQKKSEKKPLIVEETVVYSKPPPREVIVEHRPATRVEYGEPRITYGQSTVNEYREHAPSHMERRHVETRQLSPDRQHVVLHNEPVDWAKESRVRYADNGQVRHVSGEGRVVSHSNAGYNPQYSHMNPFHER